MHTDTPHTNIDDPKHPARRAARAYKRKCWWTEVDDLVQQAVVATTKAMTTFDPAVGVPLDAYLFRAAVLALKPYILSLSAPVSSSRAQRDQLKGLVRAPVTTTDRGSLDDTRGDANYRRSDVIMRTNDDDSPDIVVSKASITARVQERLHEILTDDKQTERALPVLLGWQSSAEVAEAEGISVQEVYRATLRARRRIESDTVLWQLWNEYE